MVIALSGGEFCNMQKVEAPGNRFALRLRHGAFSAKLGTDGMCLFAYTAAARFLCQRTRYKAAIGLFKTHFPAMRFEKTNKLFNNAGRGKARAPYNSFKRAKC